MTNEFIFRPMEASLQVRSENKKTGERPDTTLYLAIGGRAQIATEHQVFIALTDEDRVALIAALLNFDPKQDVGYYDSIDFEVLNNERDRNQD